MWMEKSVRRHNWSLGAYATDYWKKPGRPAMAVAEETMMRKERVKSQITKTDLYGITVKNTALHTGLTANLPMITKPISLFSKNIFADIIQDGTRK